MASRRASTTRHALPSPSNCPNVSSGVIARHHPVAVKPPPIPLEIARNRYKFQGFNLNGLSIIVI
jgi:hypothetical protein